MALVPVAEHDSREAARCDCLRGKGFQKLELDVASAQITHLASPHFFRHSLIKSNAPTSNSLT